MENFKMSGDSVNRAQQANQLASGGANPTSPLQLFIEKIPAKLACELNEKWHSRLPKLHWSNVVRSHKYICYGIFSAVNNSDTLLDYKVIGVAIWSSPVAGNRLKDGFKMLELRRLALSEDCPKNTASRVISVMVRKIKKEFPDIIKLISYQDTDVHAGTIYKASNWKMGATTEYQAWNTKNRKRNESQSKSKKIRWEYSL